MSMRRGPRLGHFMQSSSEDQSDVMNALPDPAVQQGMVPEEVSDFLSFVSEGEGGYRELYGLLSKLELFTLRIDLDSGFDIDPDQEYERLDYNDLRKELSKRFPELGYYHSVLNRLKVSEQPDQAIGDALDDLCDVVIDVAMAEQAFLADDSSNALWELRLSYDTHWARHLVALKLYLVDMFGKKNKED